MSLTVFARLAPLVVVLVVLLLICSPSPSTAAGNSDWQTAKGKQRQSKPPTLSRRMEEAKASWPSLKSYETGARREQLADKQKKEDKYFKNVVTRSGDVKRVPKVSRVKITKDGQEIK